MPINPNAAIEISAFRWVPEFAQGVVRDLRARWALEEAGLDYRVRLLDQQRPPEYLLDQPFDQVPCFSDGQVKIFETGAIVQYIGEQTEALLPQDPQGRYRAIQWTYAALNSVEPAIINLLLIDIFFAGEEWAKLRRPGAADFAKLKLKRVSEWLGDKTWLEGDRFTIGDLIMVTTLRFLRHTDLVAQFPNLDAFLKRGEARPAFQRALADQLAVYAANATPTPARRSSSMTYFEGFIAPVPEANKEAYRKHSSDVRAAVPGSRRPPDGRNRGTATCPKARSPTSAKRSMPSPTRRSSSPGSNIRTAERDAANEKFMSDPRMTEMGANMPFDGKRMIMGGFDAIVEEGSAGGAYTDGFVVPVPEGKREDYRELAAKMAKVFRQNGATRVIEAFGDDVSKGEVTDFYRAVKAEDGEGVVFSFIEWPDKATRDEAWKTIMADESLKPQGDMPFDGKRMFWGGFDKIVDTADARTPVTA